MKDTLFLFAAFLVLVSGESDLEQWLHFKSTHNKLYSSHVEDSKRYSIFQSNLRKIEEHNVRYDQGEVSYFLGVTKFADQTQEEFSAWLKRSYGNGTRFKSTGTFKERKEAGYLPDAIDWREKNAVTEIKDQQQCGGCWAFASVAAVEGAHAIKYNKLVSFSEQQLLDCATEDYSMDGCDGGWDRFGIQYVADHGIETEADYPFKGYNQRCQYHSDKVATQIKEVVYVDQHSAAALKAAVALKGPCSAAIFADGIYLYKGGIFDGTCYNCDDCLNHAITVVGYGTENNTDYWIIKNSWGKLFGEDGYIRMKRGVNQCGVEVEPHYAAY